jgi:hypothetical protein
MDAFLIFSCRDFLLPQGGAGEKGFQGPGKSMPWPLGAAHPDFAGQILQFWV